MSEVVHALPEDIDHTALAKLLIQPCEKLTARRAISVEQERLGHVRLSCVEKPAQLDEIDAYAAVIVLRVPQQPSCPAGDGSRFGCLAGYDESSAR